MYRALLQLLYYLLDLEVQRTGSGEILRPSYVGCKPQRRSKQLWRELSVLVTINTFLRYCSSKNSAVFSFFLCLGFLSQTFMNDRTAGEGGRHFFSSSLPLLPASQTLRHQPDDYCRGLTSAHRQQPDSNHEPLVSERKSLTIKLHALSYLSILDHAHNRLFPMLCL